MTGIRTGDHADSGNQIGIGDAGGIVIKIGSSGYQNFVSRPGRNKPVQRDHIRPGLSDIHS